MDEDKIVVRCTCWDTDTHQACGVGVLDTMSVYLNSVTYKLYVSDYKQSPSTCELGQSLSVGE